MRTLPVGKHIQRAGLFRGHPWDGTPAGRSRLRLPEDALSRTAPIMKQIHWVPEGSLAGVFGCHEMALELVSGADFGAN